MLNWIIVCNRYFLVKDRVTERGKDRETDTPCTSSISRCGQCLGLCCSETGCQELLLNISWNYLIFWPWFPHFKMGITFIILTALEMCIKQKMSIILWYDIRNYREICKHELFAVAITALKYWTLLYIFYSFLVII